MTHPRRSVAALVPVLFAAVAAAALCLAPCQAGYAADKTDPVPLATASPLDYVPADAPAVVMLRFADLWDHPISKAAREKLEKEMPETLQQFQTEFGVAPAEIERLTVFWPTLNIKSRTDPLVVVTTRKPYDRKAVLDAAAAEAEEEKVKDRSYYVGKRGSVALAFLDANNILVGVYWELEDYLKLGEIRREGPLAPVLRLASENHLAVVGVDATAAAEFVATREWRLPRSVFPPATIANEASDAWYDVLIPNAVLTKPLLKARLATLTVDLGKELRFDLRVTFGRDIDAKDGIETTDAALELIRGGLGKALGRLAKDGNGAKTAALLEPLQNALKAAKPQQDGPVVKVEAAVKIDEGPMTAALGEAATRMERAVRWMRVVNGLRRLYLGVQNYNDAHGYMPTADISGKSGGPLLSWRVRILPYIGEGELYKQFHLDEPWDGEHNKRLLEKMPEVFAPKDAKAFTDHETFFQGFVGRDTVFERGGLQLPRDVLDGMSKTILFVEAATPVPWTKPEDIPFDEGNLLPRVGGLSEGGFLVVLCDGQIRFFPRTIKEETLHVWIMRGTGQVKEDPDK